MIAKFNILFHTEQTNALNELDVDFDIADCEIRPMTFYNINAIAPCTEQDYTIIYSNNSEFICPLPYNKVEKILDNPKIRFS